VTTVAELARATVKTRGDYELRVLLTLYCWRCNTVHELPAQDVEKVIYALGATVADAYAAGAEDPAFGLEQAQLGPDCLLEMLRAAGNPEVYTEHVEQGVECRERTTVEAPAGWIGLDEARELVAGTTLDAERRGELP
jgi:hypothetical protein